MIDSLDAFDVMEIFVYPVYRPSKRRLLRNPAAFTRVQGVRFRQRVESGEIVRHDQVSAGDLPKLEIAQSPNEMMATAPLHASEISPVDVPIARGPIRLLNGC